MEGEAGGATQQLITLCLAQHIGQGVYSGDDIHTSPPPSRCAQVGKLCVTFGGADHSWPIEHIGLPHPGGYARGLGGGGGGLFKGAAG